MTPMTVIFKRKMKPSYLAIDVTLAAGFPKERDFIYLCSSSWKAQDWRLKVLTFNVSITECRLVPGMWKLSIILGWI